MPKRTRYHTIKNQSGTAELPEVSYLPTFMVRERGELPPQLVRYLSSLESFIDLTGHIRIVMYLSALTMLVWLTSSHYSTHTRERLAGPQPQADRKPSGAQLANGSAVLPVSVGSALANEQPKRAPRSVASGEQQHPRRARIFSKVDEEIERQMLKKGAVIRAQVLTARGENANAATDANEQSADSEQAEAAAAEAEGASASAEVGKTGAGVQRESRRKNWLAQVVASMIRAIGGIRSSLNEAGTLDDTVNDYQDKRLEELAGKIDNWMAGRHADENSPEETSGEQQAATVAANSRAELRASKVVAEGLPNADCGGLVRPMFGRAPEASVSQEAQAPEVRDEPSGGRSGAQPQACGLQTESSANDKAPAPATSSAKLARQPEMVSKATSVDLDLLFPRESAATAADDAYQQPAKTSAGPPAKNERSDSGVKLELCDGANNAGADKLAKAAGAASDTADTQTIDDEQQQQQQLARQQVVEAV